MVDYKKLYSSSIKKKKAIIEHSSPTFERLNSQMFLP